MENGHHSQSGGAPESGNPAEYSEMLYEKKYKALLKRCTTLQQNNEWLVNRLHHVKKLLRKIRHERRFLRLRLDSHQDRYADVPLILPTDPDLELAQDPAGIPVDLLPFCSGSSSTENRPSNKGSRGNQPGKTLTAAAGSAIASTSGKTSSKGSGKRKARSSKDKDRATSKKCVAMKQATSVPSLHTSAQQSNKSDDISETLLRQIKEEDLSNDAESRSWPATSVSNTENKKDYYDLYEHSYDLHPPVLDLGINTMAMLGNAGTLS